MRSQPSAKERPTPAPSGGQGGLAELARGERSGQPRQERGEKRPVHLCAGGLEQLDRVAGGIVEQDLLAARARDDVVAKRQPRGAQPLHLAGRGPRR